MTVLTSGSAGGQGKTVQLVSGGQHLVSSGQQLVTSTQQLLGSGQQLVMSGGQQMVLMQGAQPTASVTSCDGPVTSDAALAQLAAEAGLMEGEEGVALLPGEVGGQVDGGMVTPQEGEVVDIGRMDLAQYLNMFSSQVDGDPGDIDEQEGQEGLDQEQEGQVQEEQQEQEQEQEPTQPSQDLTSQDTTEQNPTSQDTAPVTDLDTDPATDQDTHTANDQDTHTAIDQDTTPASVQETSEDTREEENPSEKQDNLPETVDHVDTLNSEINQVPVYLFFTPFYLKTQIQPTYLKCLKYKLL